MVINLLREPFFVNFKLLKGLNFIAFLSFISENTELRSNENSGQAHRARQETDSSKFLELLYYLPKKGEGGLTFLASQLCWIEQFPQTMLFLTRLIGDIVVKGWQLLKDSVVCSKDSAGACWRHHGMKLHKSI